VNNLEVLIKNLYATRRATKFARVAFLKKIAEVGMCCEPDGPCYYNSPDDPSEWCDVCKERQPFWLDWKEKSKQSGIALRLVLIAGKKLAATTQRNKEKR